MAVLKMWLGIFYIIGIPSYFLGIFLHLNDWKGWLLLLLGVGFLLQRMYWFNKEKKQKFKEKELELKIKEHQLNRDIFS